MKWVVLALDLQEKDPVCSCGTTCMEEELECWEFTSRIKMGNKLWSSPRQEIRADYGGLAKLHFSPKFSLTGWVAQTSVIWNRTSSGWPFLQRTWWHFRKKTTMHANEIIKLVNTWVMLFIICEESKLWYVLHIRRIMFWLKIGTIEVLYCAVSACTEMTTTTILSLCLGYALFCFFVFFVCMCLAIPKM